jgi:hypothetical protein
MKIQKIKINRNHKVLLFDIGTEKEAEKKGNRTIMKMVYMITTK